MATTLTLASGSWTDSTHYAATYDVADANVAVDERDDRRDGREGRGRERAAGVHAGEQFGIDTLNPTVTAVAVNDTLLTDADVGRRQVHGDGGVQRGDGDHASCRR